MNNNIPGMIVDSIVKNEGTDELVGLATVTLPDIENVTEEIVGMGVGKFEEVLASSFQSMTLGLKFMGMTSNIAFSKGKTNSLIITAAIDSFNKETHENEEKKLVCSVKGKMKKRTGGEIGRENKNEPEIELALTYYKLEIDGEVIYEIDKFNKKAIVDGEDLRASINNILG